MLQTGILEPVLGIGDVRTDKRIDFVGGIRGTKELERLVDAGTYAVTATNSLTAVASAPATLTVTTQMPAIASASDN